MVMSVERVVETVDVVPRPSYQQSSVYTELKFSDHRRHREQVDFGSVLHPVKYSDTAIVYINNTRKRFISRTFYEPRVRPRTFSETTFTHPKSVEQHFVTYLDHHTDEDKKWFKTYMEIKAKKFTSARVLRSANNNYITSSTEVSESTSEYNSYGKGINGDMNGGTSFSTGGEKFVEKYDPGASQVYIPQRRDRPVNDGSLLNGELVLDFPNSKVDINMNGPEGDFSEV